MTEKKTQKRIPKQVREAYALIGSFGGKATSKKGKNYMSNLGKKGAQSRWAKKKTTRKAK